MTSYHCKVHKLSGTSYPEVSKQARLIFHTLAKKTKRRPYIRSAYFKKDKIFLDYFWDHINQKPQRERRKRLQYLSCAIDLLKNSHHQPGVVKNPHKQKELLYRFGGVTPDKEPFFVQVKEDLKNCQKYLMSVFPLT